MRLHNWHGLYRLVHSHTHAFVEIKSNMQANAPWIRVELGGSSSPLAALPIEMPKVSSRVYFPKKYQALGSLLKALIFYALQNLIN